MGADELGQEKETPSYWGYQTWWPSMSYTWKLMELTPQFFQHCSTPPSWPQHPKQSKAQTILTVEPILQNWVQISNQQMQRLIGTRTRQIIVVPLETHH